MSLYACLSTLQGQHKYNDKWQILKRAYVRTHCVNTSVIVDNLLTYRSNFLTDLPEPARKISTVIMLKTFLE